MKGRVGRQLHFKRDQRLCQIVEAVLLIERSGTLPTVHSIAQKIGMRPSTRVRDMVNDLSGVGMFTRIETTHWNGLPKFVYKINPDYVNIPDLTEFADVCKGYGYQIPLFGFESGITHDKSASE